MNGCDVIIDDFLINKLEVKWKENMEDAHQKKIIDLNYVDHFDYKFIIITKINVFKSYMDTTHFMK